MILSGKEIIKNINNKKIEIIPFDETAVGPNSYDLHLDKDLLVYDEEVLDMKKINKTKSLVIPKEGLVLIPGKLYLGRTVEYTKTNYFAPMLEGRSSIGRLGIFIHATAGFGDIGFAGTWTLEISCIEPIKIYPNVRIGQIYFHDILGEKDILYKGKYLNQEAPKASNLYKDFY